MNNQDEQMPVEERERVILELLDESGLALPLRPLYRNLKRKKGITFSQRTVQRRLKSLVEDGYVRELDIGNGYYEITERGREFLEDHE